MEESMSKELQLGKEAEEKRRFLLEWTLKQYIVGQEDAITTVATAVCRKENGSIDGQRPLVFLFLGSSGTGKRELAKQLAKCLNKEEDVDFICLDMLEYNNGQAVAKLIGAPSGSVGHDAGGQLTEQLRKFPDAVVLFEYINYAHRDVLDILLQLFDEGQLTDGKGETVECKGAIFIMTSSLACKEIAQHALSLRQEAELIREQRLEGKADVDAVPENITISPNFKENVVLPILKQHFRQHQSLGRMEIVFFLPFCQSELLQLVTNELNFWARKALSEHKIELSWDDSVLAVLAAGYSLHRGAYSIEEEVMQQCGSRYFDAKQRNFVGNGSIVRLLELQTGETRSRITLLCFPAALGNTNI